ncbi:MAG: metallophosphoesterase [Oscillospiraceae bacterium]|nr:metallophosphoesterase [Oscillospiraceae bacterium]
MKILVLSDSHSSMRFMRSFVYGLKPDAVVHLGDYYDDGQAIAEEFKISRFYQVPGNCDKYRLYSPVPETLVQKVCGVKLFMTHGHNHRVKSGLELLLADARKTDAQAVLFGHTHEIYCRQEQDGLWVINPGSCGYGGGSAALIEVENNKITGCRIFRQPEAVRETEETQEP